MIRSSRTALALMAVASSMPVTISIANAGEDAGYSGYSSLAQREMIRRQEAVSDADVLFNEGREAYAKGEYQVAVDKYRQALDRLPQAPSLADRRESYTAHLTDASVALAMQHRKVGKYSEARELLENVLSPGVDPENGLAKQELAYLDDPIRTNPALTYEHTENIDQVRRGLYMAEGNYNLGKFAEAKSSYEDVLRIDPYNTAARRGMERVAKAKTDYYRAAYDQTRAELLMEVDAAWELSVPATPPDLGTGGGLGPQAGSGSQYLQAKLRRIYIPQINFEDTPINEAIEFLRQRAVELDTTELDPTKKGVNIIVRTPQGSGASADAGVDAGGGLGLGGSDVGSLRIPSLQLSNVPLEFVLTQICQMTGLRVKVDDFAVSLVPLSDTSEELTQRTFKVNPDFANKLNTGGDSGGGASDDPFADTSSQPRIGSRPPIKDLLARAGVTFGEGANATLSGGTLVVTNTSTQLENIQNLIDNLSEDIPKQVKITTKFVEISQENTDELGFDWIVSPFGLSANHLFGSGGTVGSGTGKTGSDFIGSVGPNGGLGTSIPGIGGASDPVTNIVTGGLRSGDSAISSDGIDSILNNPNRTSQNASSAPGIMALTGLFSDGQVQMIMRGLEQKKGTDLMTAPSVVARNQQKATIEIIREFIYPTEYEPPELPNSVGATGGFGGLGGGLGGGSSGIFPVTPATPTAFETRNTGVTLEIEPTIGDNNFLIDLQFVPEIVEFEGFINYGSPIQSPSSNVLGEPVTVTITDNRIEMPVFSSRRVTTGISIYDGYTVAVGGLMREDVQNVEDQVPIFGDIPLIGRLFQSKAENRIKSNLIVFVTAQIIDATGTPIHGNSSDAIMPVSTTMDPGVLPPPQ